MVSAPFGVTIRPRPTVAIGTSPYGVIMLVPAEAGMAAANNEITEITDANLAAQLGAAANFGRRWYEYLESKANIHIAAIPFDDTDPEVNGPVAVAALESSVERAKLSFSPDILLIPQYPALVLAASAILTEAETACQNPSVLCRAITDGYNPAGVGTGVQADVITWARANTGPNVLAIGNDAPVAGANEFGSVIVAAHICQDAATNGVGSHPFNLSTPVSGVGTPDPLRVFDLNDGSAEAEALADEYVSSIIVYDGQEYVWNGKLKTAVTGDPREYFGNAVISDRMVKRARSLLAPYYGQRASTGVLADMADHVQLGLTPEFVTPGLVGSVTVLDPYLSGNSAIVEFEVGFHGFIEAIRLTADIYIQAA